jgi:hypothetical protein
MLFDQPVAFRITGIAGFSVFGVVMGSIFTHWVGFYGYGLVN